MNRKSMLRKRVISIIMSAVLLFSPMCDMKANAAVLDVPYDISITRYSESPKAESHLKEYIEYKKELVKKVEEKEPEKKGPELSEEDIRLIALVTMAEAEGESELGKRLVIDTVLNRMDHETKWPDTIYGVIYQPHQFTSMWNGRVNRCYVRDDIVQLVREELESRTNSECVYFRMDRYSDYGTPMFREGCHYFSKV